MRRRFMNLRLGSKLAILFAGFVLLPVIISYLLLSVHSTNIIREREIGATARLLDTAQSSVEASIYNYEQKSLLLYQDQDFFTEIHSILLGKSSVYDMLSCRYTLEDYFLSDRYIESCYLFLTNGDYVYADSVVTSGFPALYHSNEAWRANAEALHGKAAWTESFRLSDGRIWISCMRQLRDVYRELQIIGVLSVNLNTQFLTEACASGRISENSMMMIVDEAGSIIWSSNASESASNEANSELFLRLGQTGETTFDLKSGGNTSLVIRTQSRQLGWSFVAVIPYDDINQQSVSLQLTYFYILLCLVVFMVLCIVFVRRFITTPIHHVTVAMDRLRGGAVDIKLTPNSRDEIGYLYRTFNQMNTEIQELLAKNNATQDKLKRQEIAVLQAQINPHFLYNTLDAINWAVGAGENDIASGMIISLSEILRYALSDYNSFATIAEELNWAKHYINIQNARFHGKFTVTFQVDDTLLSCKAPRFILQPFIENAINHGFAEMDSGGELRIEVARDEGTIRIAVTDNGCGIPAEEIDDILHGCGSGIGVYNSLERVRLIYGEQYGIQLLSDGAHGAAVIITIPLLLGD